MESVDSSQLSDTKHDTSEKVQEKSCYIPIKRLCEEDKASVEIHKKMPRSQRKRLMKEQRLANRRNKKQKVQGVEPVITSSSEELVGQSTTSKDSSQGYLSKKIKLQQAKERCLEAMKSGQRVCVDLSLESNMNAIECSKLAQQLCRLYGSNRRADKPLHIYFTGINKEGELYKECVRKNDGFERYLVDMKEEKLTELFPLEDIVYMSPDSENTLEELDKNKVYVIGGLVDESVSNNITKGKATENLIQTAKLPIDKYMEKGKNGGSFNKVLSVNQVFDILLEVSQSGDWQKALECCVPKRTGYVLKRETEKHE